jgi:hypothetical protein
VGIYRKNYAALDNSLTNHDSAISVSGLEDLFQWASDMVAYENESPDQKRKREREIRSQVLEVVEKHREQDARARVSDELSYLQRRLIALLQRLTETIQENGVLRQIAITQYFEVNRIHALEAEIKQLKEIEFDEAQAREQQAELLNCLSKVQKERDFLDDLLRANEEENIRLAKLYEEAQKELAERKAWRWWHVFWSPSNP